MNDRGLAHYATGLWGVSLWLSTRCQKSWPDEVDLQGKSFWRHTTFLGLGHTWTLRWGSNSEQSYGDWRAKEDFTTHSTDLLHMISVLWTMSGMSSRRFTLQLVASLASSQNANSHAYPILCMDNKVSYVLCFFMSPAWPAGSVYRAPG